MAAHSKKEIQEMLREFGIKASLTAIGIEAEKLNITPISRGVYAEEDSGRILEAFKLKVKSGYRPVPTDSFENSQDHSSSTALSIFSSQASELGNELKALDQKISDTVEKASDIAADLVESVRPRIYARTVEKLEKRRMARERRDSLDQLWEDADFDFEHSSQFLNSVNQNYLPG